ncbi:MAG: GGDEF domain-containing protein [Verrucomicrobia bacterium]|nr:GGDEF domain-containing protein [Verrucomicrobiota bacterium]
MEDKPTQTGGSVFRPDAKELVGEGYKELTKMAVAGLAGALGLWLANQIPVLGSVLGRSVETRLYQLLLLGGGAGLLGFAADRLLVRKRLNRLSEQAGKDELTGLLNLRMEKTLLAQEMQTAAARLKAKLEGHEPAGNDGLCLIFIDIDNFKRVNDENSYESGDFVLQQLAVILDTNRKVTDHVFRHGGDEFVILTPRTPAAGALVYAEKLRNVISATKFKVRVEKPDVSLTISAGVAEMVFPGNDTPEELTRRATLAYKRAKQIRNSVALHQPEAKG